MSAGTTTSAANQYQAYRSTELLTQIQETVALAQFGLKKSIPKNQGAKQITFYRPQTVSSTNVVTPTEGQAINVFTDCNHDTATATLVEYISSKRRSDIRDATELFDFHDQATKDINTEFSEKMDDVVRDVMNASGTGFSIRRAGQAASFSALNTATSASTATMVDMLANVTYLRTKKAIPFDDMGCFVCVMAPQVQFDLMKSVSQSNVTWFDTNKYENASKLFKAELGKVFGARFVLSTNPYVATGSGTAGDEFVFTGENNPQGATVPDGGTVAGSAIYSSYMFGKESFGIPDLAGMGSFKPTMYVVDKPDSANPALQHKTISGKAYYTSLVLKNTWGIAYKSKSSQNFN